MAKNTIKAKIYVNGGLVGFHEDPEKLRLELIKKRRSGQINPQINIYFNELTNELYISTDAGRVQRPVIVVEKGIPKLTTEILEEIKKKETFLG